MDPVAGCSVVTAGCTNCYAMAMAKRLEAMGVEKYAGLTRKTGRRTVWNGVVREDKDALTIPHRWRKPRKIFVNSMSDLFHEQVSNAFILDVWRVMRETPHHNYQILTKRPERMAELVATKIGEVLPNVWLGTSIEDVSVVNRIEHLRRVPAAIRFISFEPLIGSVGADRPSRHRLGDHRRRKRQIRSSDPRGMDRRNLCPMSIDRYGLLLQTVGNLGQGQHEALEESQRPRVSWTDVGRNARLAANSRVKGRDSAGSQNGREAIRMG